MKEDDESLMLLKTRCPNCGRLRWITKTRCPWCGTPYIGDFPLKKARRRPTL